MKLNIFTLASLFGASLFIASCGGGEDKKETPAEDTTAKAEVPAEPVYEYKYKVEEVEVAPRWAIVVGDSLMLADVGPFMEKTYPAIGKFMGSKKIEPEPPFSVTYNFSKDKKFYMNAGMYVNDSTLKVKAPMKLEKMYAGKAVKVVYLGNYSKIEPAYMDIEQYMKEHNMQPAGAPWEQYMNDPMTVKDTAQWETHVYFPVMPAEGK